MSIRDFATHIGLGEFVDKINDMSYLKSFVICGNYNCNDCDIFISIYIYMVKVERPLGIKRIYIL